MVEPYTLDFMPLFGAYIAGLLGGLSLGLTLNECPELPKLVHNPKMPTDRAPGKDIKKALGRGLFIVIALYFLTNHKLSVLQSAYLS